VRLGFVTVFLWVASRVFDLWLAHKRRVADRDAFIRAIYAEVDFNTFDMTRFLDATVPLERLETLFHRPDFVPHITDARHTEVYRSRINELHAVVGKNPGDGRLVGDLVRFYGELEKVTQQIEGLSKPSFLQISVKGKVATLSMIYNTCAICERIGTGVLGTMKARYPHLHLVRNHDRSDVALDSATLAKRLKKLALDLDRVD